MEVFSLYKLTERAASLRSSPEIDVTSLSSTELLLEKLKQENIVLGPQVVETFGFNRRLKWVGFQAKGDPSFFFYGVSTDNEKPHLNEALATIAVDYEFAGSVPDKPDVRIAGVHDTGKKWDRHIKPVIIAACYKAKDLIGVNIGVAESDFPTQFENSGKPYSDWWENNQRFLLPLPTNPSEPLAHTEGFMTVAMMNKANEYFTFLSYRYSTNPNDEFSLYHRPVFRQGVLYTRLDPATSVLSVEYRSDLNNGDLQKWSVMVPAQLKQ